MNEKEFRSKIHDILIDVASKGRINIRTIDPIEGDVLQQNSVGMIITMINGEKFTITIDKNE
mgnify:CR=1 FL=1